MTGRPAPTDDEDSFLTIPEIASMDSTSEKTIRRAIAAGDLKAFRIGSGRGAIRVTRAEHRRWRTSRPI